jgi:hypothetical protein
MNPAVLNGLTRLIGFTCLVTAAALHFGAAAALTTAGTLLLVQAAPLPRRARGDQ